MTLKVIGAGVGRTGTRSLQVALERLLGGRCYQMVELASRPDHVERWRQVTAGEPPRWDDLFAGYVAAVDWPASAFWRELSIAYPDAFVVLSTRKSPEAWWRSISGTVFRDAEPPQDDISVMFFDLMSRRFTDRWYDQEAAMAAYARHNDAVRAEIAQERLIEWQPEDGWGPICAGLGLAVPSEPFPHLNAYEEYWDRWGS